MDLASQNIRQLFTARVRPAISAFWTWWTGELLAMLPEKMRTSLQPEGKQLYVELREADIVVSCGTYQGNTTVAHFPLFDEGNSTDTASNKETLPDNIRETILCLSRDKALVKPLSLPLATEENLREVLAFEMDRQTPFSADQVYYDYAVGKRHLAEQTLELSLVLTPRQELDTVLTALGEHGIHPDQVTVQCNESTLAGRINLLPAGKRQNRSSAPRLINIAIGMLAVILLITAVALPLTAQRNRIRTLEPLLETAQTRAEVASRLRNSVDRLISESRYLVEKKQSTTLTMQIINEITRILPDDTFIFHMQISASEVQIQGQSTSAAALIPLIESSEMLSNARFRSPVTQAGKSGLERFHLSATVQVPPA